MPMNLINYISKLKLLKKVLKKSMQPEKMEPMFMGSLLKELDGILK